MDDDKPSPVTAHVVGQDLDHLSIAEIDERIAALRAEVARLDAARARKSLHMTAASGLFGART